MLICPNAHCRKAVQPHAFVEHLRIQHQTGLDERKKVGEYVKRFKWDYSHITIQLPEDGASPQAGLPVEDGMQCRQCPFKSKSRKMMKTHGNTEHNQKRADDAAVFQEIRMQSWFQDHRQRYWAVKENGSHIGSERVEEEQDGDDEHLREGSSPYAEVVVSPCPRKDGHNRGVRNDVQVDEDEMDDSEDSDTLLVPMWRKRRQVQRAEERRARPRVTEPARFMDSGIIMESDTGFDGLDVICAPKAMELGRSQVMNIPSSQVISIPSSPPELFPSRGNNRGVEAINECVQAVENGVHEIGDDDEEVFSDFDDSEDADYEESSAVEVIGDEEENSSGIETEKIDEEDDEDSRTAVGDDGAGLSGIGVTEHGSDVEADDDNKEDITMKPGRIRKRKLQSAFDNYTRFGIHSKDDTYQQLSPQSGDQRPRGRKQQKRASLFVDSVVVVSSSQENMVVPPSSPPEVEYSIERRPENDKKTVSEHDRTAIATAHDKGGNARIGDPAEFRFGCRYGGRMRPMLDILRDRLEAWCQTCPACYLAQDSKVKKHNITDCPRHGTKYIVEHAIEIQKYVERVGGFQGQGCCSHCGIPRAICQRWQSEEDGDWEELQGQRCQYIGKLIPAVITMIVDGCDEGWAVVGNWMDRDEVMQTKQIEAFEWFRENTWWEGMEVARILRVFYMLVNKNRGVGKT